MSGDEEEVRVATDAALHHGGDTNAAKAAGKAAAKRYRERRGPVYTQERQFRPSGPATTTAAPVGTWSAELAAHLFSPPARWGWQAAAPVAVAPPRPASTRPRPTWIEPSRPEAVRGPRGRSPQPP
jgi:hypothetical protein